MYGLLLSIKTVTDLIRALPVGFLTLFSTNASCTVVDTEQGSSLGNPSEKQLQSTSTDNTSASSISKPRVFKDKDDSRFTTFMNHPEISEIINEYFGYLNLAQHKEYPTIKDEIYEVVAMKLYWIVNTTKGGSLKEAAIQKAKKWLCDCLHRFEPYIHLIEVSEFKLNYIPIKAWKFLIDHCGTRELWISNTTIDTAALNHPDLSKMTVLHLIGVGLTKMPCLYNLTGLKHLYLGDNKIKHVDLQSYFDAETGECNPMRNLEYLSLRGNLIFNVDARIKKVFPNPSMEIYLDETVLRHPFSDVKEKLKKEGIELTGLDRESEMDWMSRTN
ncbi:uncharacterized protein VICG_02128 [Vittaforma corneae ATCC 50505]|uniref:Leucine-rich repeat domain-containing protein n=1 Tax=Vittaforma corneae (strain ATCC 50505) TaxID=993615 RepID=L2GJY8_VITCO|nr:uncharacterized protein VICG_02128 [Vittaforma corneae ATCC 50505]ELA40835.1 hypothetical protein VICG_02128 [Vittaforma corneae ATCC 50505]